MSQPASQPWENPGPNARYCPVCGAHYLAAVFKRVGVGVWDKRMPCGHVERVVDPTKGATRGDTL